MDLSLAKLCGVALGVRLNKTQQCSPWHVRPLTADQVRPLLGITCCFQIYCCEDVSVMLWLGCNRRWSVGVCEWRLTELFLPHRIASLPHLLSYPSAHEAISPQFTCVSIFVPPHTITSCNPSKTISHHISPHLITSLTIPPPPQTHTNTNTHTSGDVCCAWCSRAVEAPRLLAHQSRIRTLLSEKSLRQGKQLYCTLHVPFQRCFYNTRYRAKLLVHHTFIFNLDPPL